MGLSGGVFGGLMNLVFGGGRNVVTETVEVFRANAEKTAERDARATQAALTQFAAEFAQPRKSLFDSLIDGMNRIPRPAMALGTIALFVAAMVDPIWFAERMQGIALVPEPLWWLLGAVVSFYFGARHQAKSQEFNRSVAATLARTPGVVEGLGALRALDAGSGRDATTAPGRGPAGAGAGQAPDEAPPVVDVAQRDMAGLPPAPEEAAAPARGGVPAGANPALAEWSTLHG